MYAGAQLGMTADGNPVLSVGGMGFLKNKALMFSGYDAETALTTTGSAQPPSRRARTALLSKLRVFVRLRVLVRSSEVAACVPAFS